MFSHLSKDIWLLSIWGNYELKYSKDCYAGFFCRQLWTQLSKYLAEWLLDHIAISIFNFVRYCKTVMWLYHFTFLLAIDENSYGSPSLPALLQVFGFHEPHIYVLKFTILYFINFCYLYHVHAPIFFRLHSCPFKSPALDS